MKHRARIATLAAAALVIAGAAIASPANARGFFGFSIAAPGYFTAPVVVDSRPAGAYAAPYYSPPAYEDSYYGDVPYYESGNEQYYYPAPSYFRPVYRHARVESYRGTHLRGEEHGAQDRHWNDNHFHGNHR